MYDVDNATSTLEDDDFLGEHECTLAQVSMCVSIGSYFSMHIARGVLFKGLFQCKSVSTYEM